MKGKQLIVGLDFGTDSVRALVVDTDNGTEIAESSFLYLDYIEGIEFTIRKALSDLGEEARKSVLGIGVDTTGSTVAAVNRDCQPLALEADFSEDPDAMFILWKDHTRE